MSDPIDKSIPPVMITNATPIPMIAKSDVRIRMRLRLFAERNLGSARAVAAMITTKMISMPKIFFIDIS